MPRYYTYIFRWANGNKDVTVIGANTGDVYRQAAKLWLPTMAKADLYEAIRFIKDNGGTVERLRTPIRIK